MMPRLDGWTLVKVLRARPELAHLPVIFLTALSSDEDRIRGFRLGADDYVPKPFRFEELDLRVAKTLRRTQAMLFDARNQMMGAGLKGDLAQIGLSALLVLIELERKTGLLTVQNHEHQVGQILVRDGRVVHARLANREQPVDADAVYHLLNWSAGEFEFMTCVVEGPDRVGTSTTQLLLEGARQLDEGRRDPLAG
jgi:DNA-binding response OmpR family regulator